MSGLKAFIVQEEDEGTGGVVFAKTNAAARRLGSSQFGDGDFNWGKARREPGLDKYAEAGRVPWIEMFNRGWWCECVGCGGRIADGETNDDGDEIEFDIVEVGCHVYCRRECREQHVAERAVAAHVKAVTIADLSDRLIKLMPGALILDNEPYCCVPTIPEPRRAQAASILFAFPGMTIGPAKYRFDKVGETPYATVCAGDRLAFMRWRAAGYPPHMMDAAGGRMTALATRIDNQDIAGWADRITACWRQSVEAVIMAGRLIAEAKAALPHGEFRALCRDHLPFGERTAQRLMAVAADARLSNPTHVSHLPPAWGTLYELTRLDDEQFALRIADGTIRPDMDRKDISTAVKQQVRKTREITLGLYQQHLPHLKAGLILEDYEWDDEVWSRKTGMDRHASNHYPTSSDAHSPEEIHRRRPIESIIDKRACVHAMWTTNQHLWIAMRLMALRGFEYKSNYVWGKDRVSTGRWNRSKHEILLIGTIGNPPCPAEGTQWDSLLMAPKGEHSAKPDCFYEMLEEYFPTLVKVELNARRARPGWVQWGNQAPAESAPPPAETSSDEQTGEVIESSPLPPTDFDTTIPEFLRRAGV